MAITDLSVEYHPIDTTIIISSFTAEVLDPAGISPADIIHLSDPFKVRATVTLGGVFHKMMCGKLAVQLNLENYGPAPEGTYGPTWQNLDPCGTGIYVFDFDFAAGSLPAIGIGTLYTAAFTFATKNPCDVDGPIHGFARELRFEIKP